MDEAYNPNETDRKVLGSPTKGITSEIRTISNDTSDFAIVNRKAAIQRSLDSMQSSFGSKAFQFSNEADRESYKDLSD